MARTGQEKNYVNFVKGLITEANALVFPDGSARDISNLELNSDGSVRRRAGIDFETGYELSGTPLTQANVDTLGISVHEWRSVNNRGAQNFVVVQIGSKLYFQDASNPIISDTSLGVLDFTPFAVSNPLHEQTKIQSSYGKGVMFITSNYIEPFYIEFDEDTKLFTGYSIDLKIRDNDGVDDGLEVDERPAPNTNPHYYNMRNQGWPKSVKCSSDAEGNGTTTADPAAYSKIKVGYYPSNADIFGSFKLGSSKEAVALDTFSPWEIAKYTFGNSPAPKGHYLLPAFNRNRSTVSGLSGLYNASRDLDSTRPAATAFYASRVWYAGVQSDNSGGNVYYSQILDNIEKAGNCYQEQDPTSEEANDLLATDGGVININDIGQVYSMRTLTNGLYIFASNGIWVVAGSDSGSSFTATKQSVSRLTDVGVLNPETVIEGDGVVLFFSKGGIYQMAVDELTGSYGVSNVSNTTIKQAYTDLGLPALTKAVGFYDDIGKKFFWLLDTNGGNITDTILIFDAQLGAFYLHSLVSVAATDGVPWVVGTVQKQSGGTVDIDYNIIEGNDNIIEGSDNIFETITEPVLSNAAVKYLTIVPNSTNPTAFNFTFSELNNPSFLDWEIALGESAFDPISYLVTSSDAFGDLLRDKQTPTASFFFNRTETGYKLNDSGGIELENPSSCFVTAAWDWSSSGANKTTRAQQIYKLNRWYIPEDVNDDFDLGYDVVTTKSKFRGKGKSLEFTFFSEKGKDFQLLGWATPVTAGNMP